MARVNPSIPALVTGASSGIGNEFARQLAARGHDLVVVARRRARLEALRDELQTEHNVSVTPLVADLGTAAGRASVVRRLEGSRHPWLLVNNAGFGTRGRVAELPARGEVAEVAVNVVAMHHLACVGMRVNTAHGEGAIVNVASMAGFQPIPYFATYAATKAFMLSFSEALAAEARGTGVRVLALCPGPVRTEFVEGVFDDEMRLVGPLAIDVDRCVRDALRALDRSQVICVPGLLQRAGTLAVPYIPRAILRSATARVQELLHVDRTRVTQHAESQAAAPAPPAVPAGRARTRRSRPSPSA